MTSTSTCARASPASPGPGSWRRPACSRPTRSSAWPIGTGRRATPSAACHPRRCIAALAGRGSAVGTVVRHGGEVLFTAPGMNETEVVAVLAAVGCAGVRAGRRRRRDGGRLRARPPAGRHRPGAPAPSSARRIDPHLVTSTPSCVSFHISRAAGPLRGPAAARPVRPARRGGRRPRSRRGRRLVNPPLRPSTAVDAPSDPSRFGPPPGLVLTGAGFDQGVRWLLGERLEDLFEERCTEAPDGLAVDAPGMRLTFAELDARANQLARHLLDRGMRAPATGWRCSSTRPCAPTSRCWRCSRSTPPTSRWTPGSRPTGWPTSSRTPACGRAVAVRACRNRARRHRRPGDRASTTGTGNRGRDSGPVAAAPSAGPCRRARVHHLHLGVHRASPRAWRSSTPASATSSGSPPRSTASARGDRVYQGMTIAFDFSVEEIWVPWTGRRDAGAQAGRLGLLGVDLHDVPRRRSGSPRCAASRRCWPPSRRTCPSCASCWSPARPARRTSSRAGTGPGAGSSTSTGRPRPRSPRPGRSSTRTGRSPSASRCPTYSTVILDPEDPTRALPHGRDRRDRHRGHRAGRRLRQPAGPDREGVHPGLPRDRRQPVRPDLPHRRPRPGQRRRRDRVPRPDRPAGQDPRLPDRADRDRVGAAAGAGRRRRPSSTRYEPVPGAVELVGYYSLRTDARDLDDEDDLARTCASSLPPYMVPGLPRAARRHPDDAQRQGRPQEPARADRRARPRPAARARRARHRAPSASSPTALAATLRRGPGVGRRRLLRRPRRQLAAAGPVLRAGPRARTARCRRCR